MRLPLPPPAPAGVNHTADWPPKVANICPLRTGENGCRGVRRRYSSLSSCPAIMTIPSPAQAPFTAIGRRRGDHSVWQFRDPEMEIAFPPPISGPSGRYLTAYMLICFLHKQFSPAIIINEAAAGSWGTRPEPGGARWSGACQLRRPDGTPRHVTILHVTIRRPRQAGTPLRSRFPQFLLSSRAQTPVLVYDAPPETIGPLPFLETFHGSW
jgi:hypothetical protein